MISTARLDETYLLKLSKAVRCCLSIIGTVAALCFLPLIASAQHYLDALEVSGRAPHFTNGSAAQQNETRLYYDQLTLGVSLSIPIRAVIPTLEDFQTFFFSSNPNPIQTNYFNRADLGLGREMNCAVNTNYVACYVSNYSGPTNVNSFLPQFGNFAAGQSAWAAFDDFATVAMVERRWLPSTADNKVFFLVYGKRNSQGKHPLVENAAQLDFQAHNTFIPGNCMVCHGGGGTYDLARHSTRGGRFLPFDLNAFDYFGATGPYSRASQQLAFRTLNKWIYDNTDTRLLPHAGVIKAWYNNWTSNVFDGTKLPPPVPSTAQSWDSGSITRDLYRSVVAPYCRTCHISQTSPLSFTSVRGFADNLFFIGNDVCVTRRMPNAERTAALFRGTEGARARQVLQQFLNTSGVACQIR